MFHAGVFCWSAWPINHWKN